MNDDSLLREYVQSDSQEAFAQLVNRHTDWVYSAAVRMVRDTHLAEDITQAVFLILAQRAGTVSNKPLNAWLFGVTRFSASHALRARYRREQHERAAAEMAQIITPLAADPFWEDIASVLEDRVGRLGRKDRQAILLRFYQGKSMAEVGAAMGISEDAAKKRVSRAVIKLRAMLKAEEAIETDAMAALLLAKTTYAAPANLAVASTLPHGGGTARVQQIAAGAKKMMAHARLKIAAWKTMLSAGIPVSIGAMVWNAAEVRNRNARMASAVVEAIEPRVLLSAVPTIVDPTVVSLAKSISLTAGAQVYIYGEETGGARGTTLLVNGTGDVVNDARDIFSTELAVSSQSSNSYTTKAVDYSIAGVGVSGFTNMQSYYGQNVISGSGYVNSGTSEVSVTFTLNQSALVVAMGLGSSQQGFTFQGPAGFITDFATVGTTNQNPLAAGIGHEYLSAGKYTIQETATVTGQHLALDQMVDLLGVYIFTSDHLAFVQQPTNVIAGNKIAPPVTVAIEDENNHVLTGDSSNVTIGLASSPTGSTLTGTATVAAVNGVATFSNLTLKTDGSYILKASDGLFTGATSNTFTVSHAAISHLAFVQNPTNVVAGVNITPGITVKATDAYGNIVAGAPVKLAISSSPVGGALIGTATATTNASGIATFSGISFHVAGLYTLIASDGAIISVKSTLFTVAHAAVAHLAFVQNPTNVIAGANISPAITVKATDAFGNLISGASVKLAIGSGSVGGALFGAITATTAATGIATFSAVSLHLAGTYTLTASDSAIVSPKSTAFSVAAAKAAKLVFTTLPVSANHGVAFAVKISVEDIFGNVLTGQNTGTITLALATHPTGSTLGGTLTVNVVKGVATFNNLTVNLAGSYSFKATDSFAVAAAASSAIVVS